MLSRIFIRDNVGLVRERLALKGYDFDERTFVELDERERSLRTEAEELRALRNRTSDEIARLKKSGGDADRQIVEMRDVSARIKAIEEDMTVLDAEMSAFLATIPNLPNETVPTGLDANANRVERTVGSIPSFSFDIQDHVDLGSRLGVLDMERATKIAGARFALYRGAGALMERALINFMLDVHTREHGYQEVLPPFMAGSRVSSEPETCRSSKPICSRFRGRTTTSSPPRRYRLPMSMRVKSSRRRSFPSTTPPTLPAFEAKRVPTARTRGG